MSILLTFNKTDFLIASFDGVLGLSVEPSALGVGLEAFFSGEKVLGCSLEPSAVGVVEAFWKVLGGNVEPAVVGVG